MSGSAIKAAAQISCCGWAGALLGGALIMPAACMKMLLLCFCGVHHLPPVCLLGMLYKPLMK